jgi:hypothetical protein
MGTAPWQPWPRHVTLCMRTCTNYLHTHTFIHMHRPETVCVNSALTAMAKARDSLDAYKRRWVNLEWVCVCGNVSALYMYICTYTHNLDAYKRRWVNLQRVCICFSVCVCVCVCVTRLPCTAWYLGWMHIHTYIHTLHMFGLHGNHTIHSDTHIIQKKTSKNEKKDSGTDRHILTYRQEVKPQYAYYFCTYRLRHKHILITGRRSKHSKCRVCMCTNLNLHITFA